MRIFISTGEVSGDLQGSLLILALKQQAAQLGLELEITALGGSQMAAAGATLWANTAAIGSVGILESLPHVFPTLKIQHRVKRCLQASPPDRVILIDYMGPNLSIGEFVRRQFPTVPIFYYIAPQEWVWSSGLGGVAQIARFTDLLLAIFPEEARYFQAQGVNVSWVGHPLIDRIQSAPSRAQARQLLGISPQEQMIVLLPASRWQEIRYLLPAIFAAAHQLQTQLPQARFWLPLSLEAFRQPMQQAIEQWDLTVTLWPPANQNHSSLAVLAAADLAITKSGTVNLELALLNVPPGGGLSSQPPDGLVSSKPAQFLSSVHCSSQSGRNEAHCPRTVTGSG